MFRNWDVTGDGAFTGFIFVRFAIQYLTVYMVMRKSLSIVIPAFNEERFIGACLDAIASQTVPPDQVIVVDNNSTDDTAKIAAGYSFVTVIKESRQGRVFARNAGFEAATGDIIGRIDSDSRLPPHWVEYVQRFYDSPHHQQLALTGGVICYNLRFPRLAAAVQDQLVFRLNRMLLGHYVLFGSNMALPAELWQNARSKVCIRQDIHEDLDLSIHLHRSGYPIAYRAGLRVPVKMRRVRSDRHELWGNLQWWPQTLRVHGNRRWPVAWLGALFLFVGAPLLPMVERLARLLGFKPLPD
jgi:glycosyltransferase involved in cell wall biosynthesis